MKKLTAEQAFDHLRQRPEYQTLIRDAYLDVDVQAAAQRFAASAEFKAVLNILKDMARGTVLDLGAGNGIASFAFAQAGAKRVIALEPDLSKSVGCGAIQQVCEKLPVDIAAAYGEALPLPSQSVDVVYARQVLHHTINLPLVMRESYRVLRPDGIFLACREHTADNAQQLATFLSQHPVHQLAGNENAYRLDEYVSAIREAGFDECVILYPYDSVINAFPAVKSQDELNNMVASILSKRLGLLGKSLGRLPVIDRAVRAYLNRSLPGRLISLVGLKSSKSMKSHHSKPFIALV